MLLTLGFFGLTLLTAESSHARRSCVSCPLIGAGMGMLMLSLLLAVQHGVDRSRLGIATSLNQFSRSIGAAIGVGRDGRDPDAAPRRRALRRRRRRVRRLGASRSPVRRALQFAAALHHVFLAGGVTAVLALIVTFFLPAVNFSRGVTAAPASR